MAKEIHLSDMGKIWRTSKCRMVERIKKAESEQERMSLKPDNIVSIAEWKAFVREKLNKTFEVIFKYIIYITQFFPLCFLVWLKLILLIEITLHYSHNCV